MKNLHLIPVYRQNKEIMVTLLPKESDENELRNLNILPPSSYDSYARKTNKTNKFGIP